MIPADTERVIRDEFAILLNELAEFNPELLDKPRLLAVSKSDLIDDELKSWLMPTLPEDVETIFISAVTNEGLDALKDKIWKYLNEDIPPQDHDFSEEE
jgi:GTP-binding protein